MLTAGPGLDQAPFLTEQALAMLPPWRTTAKKLTVTLQEESCMAETAVLYSRALRCNVEEQLTAWPNPKVTAPRPRPRETRQTQSRRSISRVELVIRGRLAIMGAIMGSNRSTEILGSKDQVAG